MFSTVVYDSFSFPMSRPPKATDYSYVQLAHNDVESKRRILFVLDSVPAEDLGSGRMLSGETGVLFKRLHFIISNYYKFPFSLAKTNWLVTAFNSYKTQGLTDVATAEAMVAFKERLSALIVKYKPDTVITFGINPFKALNAEHIERYGNKAYHFYGSPIKTTVSYKTAKTKHTHEFIHVPNISLQRLVKDAGRGDEISAAGYAARNLINAYNGDYWFKIPKLKYRQVFVDTIEKFDSMLEHIKTAKRVAIDTETRNLNRRVNKMLTIQFAASKKLAYFVPFSHKDSPFSPKELRYIKNKLRAFFEYDNTNQVHVFVNAPFDLTVMRNALGVRFFKTNAYDCFAGAWCLDENYKFLKSFTGTWYHSLLNLAMHYGCTAYYDSEFGKEKRATIHASDLTPALIEYGCLDVILPLHIMDLQMAEAEHIGYDKFYSMVAEQQSDCVHTFSAFEYNGYTIDVDYLFYLNSPFSPVLGEMEKVTKALYETAGVKAANKRLNKQTGADKPGLFGKREVQIFDIQKNAHKQELFFNVLKLEPLTLGKSGVGKIDKAFSAEYSSVEEVSLFNTLKKIQKVMNSYVKTFIKWWGKDEDMRFDRRIRPHFQYLPVVTGRTSADKPSLHQIPSRGALSKYIKRMFIAESGRILIKVDYCIAGDALIPTEKGLLRLDSMAQGKKRQPITIDMKMDSLGGTNTASTWVYTGDKPTLTLTSQSGNEITCTPEHEVFVYSGGEYKWIEARNCSVGDLLCLSKNKVVRTTPLTLHLSQPLSKNTNNSTGYTNIYQNGPTSFYLKIKHNDGYYIEKGFKCVKDAVAARNAYYVANGLPLRNRSFNKIIKPTCMTPEIAYILGAILSDGHYTLHNKHNTVYFTNTNLLFAKKYVEAITAAFGLTPTVECSSRKGHEMVINGVKTQSNYDIYTVRVKSNTLANWLNELGVYSQKGKVDGKTTCCYHVVPWSILEADEESQLAFLAAFTEGDGWIKNNVSLEWNSSSNELLKGVMAILNSHGYITKYSVKKNCYKREDGSFTTMYSLGLGRGSSQLLYSRMKKYIVSKHLAVADASDRLGNLPNGVKGDYFVSKIVSIVDSGVKPVYDLTMSDTKRPAFVANGVLVHNCAHEVRCWSLLTGDKEIADLFYEGLNLRNESKLNPSPELAQKIVESDVHRRNACYFFGVPMEQVLKEKELRDKVKGVIFGFIYQQSLRNMAVNTKQTLEDIEVLVKGFKKRFPIGVNWFDISKNDGKKNLFVESPLGRRRHVWGHIMPEAAENASGVVARMERMSVNAPVQGIGSDFLIIGARQVETLRYEHFQETGHYPDFYLANSVHDSLVFSCAYEDVWTALTIIERGLVDRVAEVVEERHGMKFTVPLEIDFELGPTEADVQKWDYAVDVLEKIVCDSVTFQNSIFENKCDVDACVAHVYNRKTMPKWAKQQLANLAKRKKTEEINSIRS